MSRKQKRNLIRIFASALLLVLGICLSNELARMLVFMAAYLVIGYDVLKEAALGIIHGQVFDENFLMAIATLGAIAIGDYLEAVAVMLFYQVGELFQSYAVGKSRASISSLMDIRPETAVVERNGKQETVAPEEVHVEEIIVIKAGDRIPLDGVIIEGRSALNTAALTGES
ncbi:MAG: heavy metal translocating P-type ATPase, partial [Clostridia bacterium]